MKKLLYISGLVFLLASCQPVELQVVEDYYKDGSPKMVMDYLVKGGDSIPVYEIQYHDDGSKLLEGNYVNGLREGEWTSWFPDGKVWSKGYFSAGKRTGKSWVYHPNNKIYMKGSYEEGKKVGLWLVFDEEGNVVGKNEF